MNVRKELEIATEVKPKHGEVRQIYLKRLVSAVSKLDDDKWDSLSKEAQSWFNDAADSINEKQAIPELPGYEEVKEESKESSVDLSKIAAGNEVELINSRDKVYTGKVVEINENEIVIESEENEFVFNKDRIKSLKVLNKVREVVEVVETLDIDLAFDVGSKIKVTTGRGKVYEGEVVDLDDSGNFVIDDGVDERQFNLDKITWELSKDNHVESDGVSEKEPGIRKVTTVVEPAPEKKTRNKKTKEEVEEKSVKDDKPLSNTMRIRYMIVENMDSTVNEIAKMLNDNGITCNDNVLKVTYSDIHKLLDILKEKSLLRS